MCEGLHCCQLRTTAPTPPNPHVPTSPCQWCGTLSNSSAARESVPPWHPWLFHAVHTPPSARCLAGWLRTSVAWLVRCWIRTRQLGHHNCPQSLPLCAKTAHCAARCLPCSCRLASTPAWWTEHREQHWLLILHARVAGDVALLGAHAEGAYEEVLHHKLPHQAIPAVSSSRRSPKH